VQGFFDFVKSLGAARMAAMAAVTLALIGFFSFLMIQMTAPQIVPRPKEEIDRIAALVRSAIGFDAKRGGQVEVFKLRFDAGPLAPSDSESVNRGAEDLEAVFDVPVQVSAVLGRAHIEVGRLLKLGPGAVLELDRKVGERSISTSTTGWWRVAKWCLSTTSSA
jgi:flagellar motor switch/type III secretory pathway protein FliN